MTVSGQAFRAAATTGAPAHGSISSRKQTFGDRMTQTRHPGPSSGATRSPRPCTLELGAEREKIRLGHARRDDVPDGAECDALLSGRRGQRCGSDEHEEQVGLMGEQDMAGRRRLFIEFRSLAWLRSEERG